MPSKQPGRFIRQNPLNWRVLTVSLLSDGRGSTTVIPEPEPFGGRTATVVKNADAASIQVEEKGGPVVAVLAGHGDLEMQANCSPDALVFLSALSISGFRMIRVPRVWDSLERRTAEADSHREFSQLARTFKTAPLEGCSRFTLGPRRLIQACCGETATVEQFRSPPKACPRE